MCNDDDRFPVFFHVFQNSKQLFRLMLMQERYWESPELQEADKKNCARRLRDFILLSGDLFCILNHQKTGR